MSVALVKCDRCKEVHTCCDTTEPGGLFSREVRLYLCRDCMADYMEEKREQLFAQTEQTKSTAATTPEAWH